MKTVLISGDGGVPAPLRDIVARGSTVLVECSSDELPDGRTIEADRIVCWSGTGNDRLRRLAEAWAKAEEGPQLMYVLADSAAAGRPDLAPDQLFIWPHDEDRLKLAFLTGA